MAIIQVIIRWVLIQAGEHGFNLCLCMIQDV
jgi:hypothetical protein